MSDGYSIKPVRMNPILGIVQDRPSESIDLRAWLTLDNFVCRQGQIQKVSGWTAQGHQLNGEVVNCIRDIRYQSGAVSTLIGTHRNWYNLVAGVPTLINNAPFTMASNQRWELDYLTGLYYFTNILDGLWQWDGINPMVQVPNVGLTAAHLVQFANHILLGNANSNDPQGAFTMQGSGLAPGVDWDVADINSDAFLAELPEDATAIQRLVRGRTLMEVYKEFDIEVWQYVGSGFGYQSNIQVPNMGLMSPAALVDLGDRRFYIGQDNFYEFDGSTNAAFKDQPQGDRVWQWWNGLIVPAARASTWAFLDRRPAQREVIIGYSQNDGRLKALVWNYQYDMFSTRDWPFNAVGYVKSDSLAAAEDPPFDALTHAMSDDDASSGTANTLQDFVLLAGDSQGGLFVLDDSVQTANGQPIVATAESGDTDFGLPDLFKICDGLWVDAPINDGQNGNPALDTSCQVYYCARRALSDPIVWQGPFLIDSTARFSYFTGQGVWWRFKFVKPDGQFVLRGYAPRWRAAGEY